MSARTFGSYCAGRGQLPTQTSPSSSGQAEAPAALYLQVDSANQRAFSTPALIITSERGYFENNGVRRTDDDVDAHGKQESQLCDGG
ncbi:expressed unknown protein [Ectocarpus siliculosus]|uniref:Uncharacterized protein n=1 Tax=Ectocarpus siliculosus TaxID=2880 RepID=D7FRZ3_ECTSI|nr:expressed unknown protein [Ectocarpus siliculosus]CBJ32271.1 expressed unknown protein [Ectocarpus siliculosus]|eukprot:CBJ30934.1 expressed unknown protein [Ectocarpus siliculosus]